MKNVVRALLLLALLTALMFAVPSGALGKEAAPA